jgi:hypothetical protein
VRRLHFLQHQESVLQALAVVMSHQEPARQKFMEAGMLPHIVSALGGWFAAVEPTARGVLLCQSTEHP